MSTLFSTEAYKLDLLCTIECWLCEKQLPHLLVYRNWHYTQGVIQEELNLYLFRFDVVKTSWTLRLNSSFKVMKTFRIISNCHSILHARKYKECRASL